ncbi:hypothetical protein Fmac_012113 [Flemingia macrophylla]|uniref:Dirigent protein n=1 Tax=Flemingia macrophylla TaxID=520843 RepID=A0ABD1MQ82_9FABA
MENHFLLLALLISCHALACTSEEETGYVGPVDPKSLGLNRKQKASHFRFFFTETFTPNNATSVNVVEPLPKYNATNFGLLGVTDNALTVGQDPKSKVVGRMEGFVAGTSQSEFNLFVIINFALTEGKYNGSSITVLGILDPNDFLALQSIWKSLRDVPGSTFFATWDFTADPCNFSGVYCIADKVVALNLGDPRAGSPGLTGKLDPSISKLSAWIREESTVPSLKHSRS